MKNIKSKLCIFCLAITMICTQMNFIVNAEQINNQTTEDLNTNNPENPETNTNVDSKNNEISNAQSKTIILRGFVQPKIKDGLMSITYAIVKTNNDPNEINNDDSFETNLNEEIIESGYLYASENYQRMINLPTNEYYYISFGSTKTESDFFTSYCNYSISPLYLTESTYVDFIYGDEKFISENQSSLSAGKLEYAKSVLSDSEDNNDNQTEDVKVATNKDKKEIFYKNFVKKFYIIALILIILFVVLWIIQKIQTNKKTH